MEEKELQTTEKAVKAKKKMEPKKKKITIAAVIVGIIAVVAILIGINHTAIMSDINYAFMPESITPTVDGVQVEFFVYKNKDFNQFKDKNTPLKAFGYYYIDENGKKVDLSWDKSYTGSKGTKFTPNVWFMIQSGQKLSKFKSVSSKVIPIIVLVVVALLIYLWFRSWCKREDARMEAMYGKKDDRHKTGNKKKKTK